MAYFPVQNRKWRKCVNFPEISGISTTFRIPLCKSRNFVTHISCENSSFPCFSHLFALLALLALLDTQKEPTYKRFGGSSLSDREMA